MPDGLAVFDLTLARAILLRVGEDSSGVEPMETSSRAYLPEAIDRMTIVLARATKELNLAGAPTCEKERLAACILSIGNTYRDVNRLLEKSVRIYLRSRPLPASSLRRAESSAFL
jgi:hypothetical protein